MALCQIHERERRQEETKGQTDPEKAADLETGKTSARGCPGRFGTLGRFERKEGAYEGART
jgi:hypothetical protein